MTVADSTTPNPAEAEPKGGDLVYRHGFPTRVFHWINALCVFIMLMSGLMIFNAHPRLYWGKYGANADAAWLEIGNKEEQGYLLIGSVEIPTTGVLGAMNGPDDQTITRAFPPWATIPSHNSLATARRWHLSFAWLFAVAGAGYAFTCFANRNARRNLCPHRHELKPGHLLKECGKHMKMEFPCGVEARQYSILQKLTYLAIIFGVLPLLVLTGLTMSPAMNAAMPWMLDVFGGRQSARSLHFILAACVVLFLIVHLAMILLAGPVNEMRSMITGWFRLPKEKDR